MLEKEMAKMIRETVSEQSNTEVQKQELTVADTSKHLSEETLLSDDTSLNDHMKFSLANTEET